MTLPQTNDETGPFVLYNTNTEATLENYRRFAKEFKCQMCGVCCKNQPEGITLLKDDDEHLARLLGISKNEFKKKHTFTHNNHRYMGGPCPFQKDNMCSIHEERMEVCRAFPFNKTVVVNGKSYITVAGCPAGKALLNRLIPGGLKE